MCTIIITAGKTNNTDDYRHWLKYMKATCLNAESQGSGATGAVTEWHGDVAFKKRPIPCRGAMTHLVGEERMPELLAIHARSGGGYPDNREYDRHHHPFPGENILLMHEGFADDNWFDLADKLGIELHTNTDSELFMHIVDREENIINGLRQAFNILGGWHIGAAIYDRRTPGKMYFASTDRRCSPYHIVKSDRFNCTTLISRYTMIRNAFSEQTLRGWGFGKITNVKPFTLYTFHTDGNYTLEEI